MPGCTNGAYILLDTDTLHYNPQSLDGQHACVSPVPVRSIDSHLHLPHLQVSIEQPLGLASPCFALDSHMHLSAISSHNTAASSGLGRGGEANKPVSNQSGTQQDSLTFSTLLGCCQSQLHYSLASPPLFLFAGLVVLSCLSSVDPDACIICHGRACVTD